MNDIDFPEQCGILQPKQATQNEIRNPPSFEISPTSDVETDLFIGLPEARTRFIPTPRQL